MDGTENKGIAAIDPTALMAENKPGYGRADSKPKRNQAMSKWCAVCGKAMHTGRQKQRISKTVRRYHI
jgi:hypothetical protein